MLRTTIAGQVAAFLVGLSTLFPGISLAQGKPAVVPELNTILMKSTYMILGPKRGDKTKVAFGTAFLMGKPIPNDNARSYYVLITAKHVFDDIEGDVADLRLRVPQSDGSYTERPWQIQIRDRGKNLYAAPADADVAALYVDMPDDLNVTILPTSLLADDKMMDQFELHPGDELLCLGFPLGVSAPGAFPVLRSGKIASYPITPTSVYRTMYFDFSVFPGNSGGPVYFVDHGRTYGGSTRLGETIQFVVGLVSQQLSSSAYNNEEIRLAAVVPAAFIVEALQILPATSPYK